MEERLLLLGSFSLNPVLEENYFDSIVQHINKIMCLMKMPRKLWNLNFSSRENRQRVEEEFYQYITVHGIRAKEELAKIMSEE